MIADATRDAAGTERAEAWNDGPRTGATWESGAAAALIAAALAFFLLHVAFLHRDPIDDAGISVAYARSLAEGHGFRVTAESAAAEGFSNPAWTFVLFVLELFGVDTVPWLNTLGVMFACAGMVLVALWGPAAERRSLRLEDALAPLVAAAHPAFVHWAQGGLETGQQVFTMGLVGWLALGAHSMRRAGWLGIAAAVLTLTRPEGALYVLAAGIGWPLTLALTRRMPGRAELRLLLCAGLPVLAYVLFRRLYFSEWLPNTYFSKHAWDFQGGQYLRNYYSSHERLIAATVLGFMLSLVGPARRRVRGLTAGLCVGALVYFAYWAKGDWMREWRFIAPGALFQGACIGAGASVLRAGLSGLVRITTRGTGVRLERALGAALFALIAWRLVPAGLDRSELVRRNGMDVSITSTKGTRFELAYGYLKPFGMVHPLVVASDMGVIALGMRDAELWDFGGLTDMAISHLFDARYKGVGPALEDYMQHEGPPSLALAWGPANFFPATRMASWYHEVGHRHYLLNGLTPEVDPRCPGGKALALSMPRAELKALVLGELRAGKAVRALARWRCAHAYRRDQDLPGDDERIEMAKIAERVAERERARGAEEPALRAYSLCAVLAIKSAPLGTSCRKRAETIRARLFNR